MHVGLIIYGSLDTLSGGYLYDRQLVTYLREQGDTVEILGQRWGRYGRLQLQNFAWGWWQRLCQTPFDLLLQDELNHPSLWLLNRWLRRYATYPIISIVHHLRCNEARPEWQNKGYRWFERRYLQTVDGFIFNSQTTQATVQQLVGKTQPFVVAYPAGNRFSSTITQTAIISRAQQPGPLRLLFVGNLIARKGLHSLIVALRQLPPSLWQLDVIGNMAVSPAYTRFIQQQIAPTQLPIRLHGVLSDEALAQQAQQSHLLVVPSTYEGFGIVYLEGMGFGLPAIGTTTGAAHELITHGHNGFLVLPGETAVLGQHIQQLSQDRQLLIQMSLAAYQRYTQHPTWRDSTSRMRHFLQNIPYIKNR